MPQPSAISNQSSIQGGAGHLRLGFFYDPPVVMQAQPTENAPNNENFIITVGTPTTGAVADVLADYTVLITPSADYKNDLQYRADACFIGYARRDGDGSTVYVGKTPYQWTTSSYVTVLKEVRIHERKMRVSDDGTVFHDTTIPYRTPKPRMPVSTRR